MFSIGDFSMLARVSRRVLSNYEILGLLRPELFDELSGEHCYSAAQLPRLNRIVVLKELGFAVEDIVRLVDHVPAAELRGMVLLRRFEAGRLSDADAEAGLMQRLLRAETRITQIEDQCSLGAQDVMLREEPSRRFLCMRETLPSFAKVRAVLRAIADSARSSISPEALGPLMVVSHSREFELEHMDMQLGMLLGQSVEQELRLPDRRRLSTEDLPAVACMAICARTGTAEHAHLMTARLARFVEDNGYRLAGPSREMFIEAGEPTTLPAVIEMQFPLTARSPSHREARRSAVKSAEQ
jgi:DNA-binding transcriptional MerR regulator